VQRRLHELSRPSLPSNLCRKFEAAIASGQTVRASHIECARQAHASRRPADQPARMAASGTIRHWRYVMLPGMKQRIEVPSGLFIGQTIVLPARFGSVITASSGTSIHWPSSLTR